MKNSKFSIIVPCYNSEKYIGITLQSVIQQDFANYEIICVDDGSTDETLNKIKYWKSKFNGKLKIIAKRHRGVSRARNIGLRRASGEYIVFLDSDDKMEKRLLYSLNEVIEKSNPDCIIGGFKCEAEEGIRLLSCEDIKKDKIIDRSQEEVFEYLFQQRFIMAVWRFVIRSEIVKRNKILFNEGVIHEDEEWLTKILLYCKSFQCIDIPFITYIKRKNSITTNPTNFNYISKLEIAKNLLKFSESFVGYKKIHILRKTYRLCKEIYYTLMEQAGDKNSP